MRELRVLGAVVLATCGWWALVLIGRWFEPGESFLIAWFLYVPLGPVLSAVIVTAPRFRGTEMKAPAMAAAIISPFVVLGITGSSSDSGAFLPAIFILVMVLVGLITGWGVSEMVALSQDPEGKSEDDQDPRSPW
jgi:hypothetical protein